MEFSNEINNSCAFHIDKHICTPPVIIDKLFDFLLEYDNDNSIKDINSVDDNLKSDYIITSLKKKLNCNDEVCILNNNNVKNFISPFIVEKTLHENFKPTGPRDNFNWLSNHEIDAVLNQISKKYTDKKFLHIPYQMIDFEKQKTELATLNWPQKYQENYRTFGVVVNTDYSKNRGQHWFAIFGDFLDDSDHFSIEYFNSSGELPLIQITFWFKKIIKLWSDEFSKEIKEVIVTRLINQEDTHSCGPYSLYYIISRLEGVPYSYFKNNKIGDKNMHLFRKYLFRKS